MMLFRSEELFASVSVAVLLAPTNICQPVTCLSLSNHYGSQAGIITLGGIAPLYSLNARHFDELGFLALA